MEFDNATNLDRKSGSGTIMICFHCFPRRTSYLLPPRMAKAMVGLRPDFLWGLGESRNLMRLSLQKAAHANIGSAAYRKSGSPVFFVPRTPGRTWGTRNVMTACERLQTSPLPS